MHGLDLILIPIRGSQGKALTSDPKIQSLQGVKAVPKISQDKSEVFHSP